VTGLFRTSLLFFLPIFFGFFLYHSWQSAPGVIAEEKATFLAHYSSSITTIEDLAENFLKKGDPDGKIISSDLSGTPILLTEGIRNGTSVFRLVNPILADDPSWRMFPDPDISPSFFTGFRFSVAGESIPSFLVERTIYDAEGNPVALNIYIREENPSHDVLP